MSLVIDDVLRQKAMQSDDSAFAVAHTGAQVGLIVEARWAGSAATADGGHHQVARTERSHGRTDLFDHSHGFMPQYQIVAAIRYRLRAAHWPIHHVTVSPTHAHAEHTNEDIVVALHPRHSDVGQPCPTSSWAGDHGAHQ